MKIRFLGTGTSTGVPEIGCECAVCISDDWRDKRLRCSVQIETDDANIIIDCTPDFRQQMLQVPFQKIDAILITHEHFDHVGGIEDLRPFCRFGTVETYAEPHVAQAIENRMPYVFNGRKYRGIPDIGIVPITSLDPFRIKDTEIIPIRVMHHKLPILGFRIGGFAYLTDVKQLPEEDLGKLSGLDLLVASALREEEHISHQTLAEAIALAEKINPKQTFFTHMSHQIGLHRNIESQLPPGFSFAFDGLEISLK